MFLAVFSKRFATPPPKRSGTKLLTDPGDVSIDQNRILTESSVSDAKSIPKSITSSNHRKHRLLSQNSQGTEYDSQKLDELSKVRTRSVKTNHSIFDSKPTHDQGSVIMRELTNQSRSNRIAGSNPGKIKIDAFLPAQPKLNNSKLNDKNSFIFATEYLKNRNFRRFQEKPLMHARNDSFIHSKKLENSEEIFTKEPLPLLEPKTKFGNDTEIEKNLEERKPQRSILKNFEPPESSTQQVKQNSLKGANTQRRVSSIKGHVSFIEK